MRPRPLMWVLPGLLLLAGAWFFWHSGSHPEAQKKSAVQTTVATVRSASTAPKISTGQTASKNSGKNNSTASSTNKFAYRLSNTTKSLDELMRDDKAVLLANALIDTRNPLNFSIPANLKSQGDPGAYIVQANGPIDNAFRAMLASAGATIVSYIPNDAYLVRISADGANAIASDGFSVVPYEPYYKVQSPLLAFDEKSLPAGTALNLGLFGDDAQATIQQIQQLGAQIFAQDSSPFGTIVRVIPPQNWTALAELTGVQIVEPYHKRVAMNDLARVTLGISTNTITPTNYMGLTGKNVTVDVNDTGIDAGHPDFTATGNATSGPSGASRVIGDVASSLMDTNGHGTHVAGIIAGNGSESSTINQSSNTIPQGSVTNADFRGKAPLATLFSVGFLGASGEVEDVPDSYLQAEAALTNALISNNSWGAEGDDVYDLEAASFDAAVRDALPYVTGSQPVLFVFAAGNDGGGDNDGGSGSPDTISSPATAKNVITVGALEQLRNITNYVTALNGSSNQTWLPMTDTSYEAADYSSRGNVEIGIEGTFGRFKPDVVAPGTFVVSTRSEQWNQAAYYNPTNTSEQDFTDQIVDTNSANYYSLDFSTIPNAVGVTIQVVPNVDSPSPLNLPVYVSSTPNPNNYPDPATPSTYFMETNTVTIPPNGGAGYLASAIAAGGFNYAVGDSGITPVDYDLIVTITTTNDNGNYFQVLSNQLNAPLAPWYRYETGTSMATPSVSGLLALMQDFFTNQWHMLPSPALLKAMLINGARTTSSYDLQVQNSINFEGWGLANLPDSLPFGMTNQTGVSCSSFILDQNPTNALATGDSQTFFVNLTNAAAQTQPLRITLAWTDPPGNPAAAIKLVNNLSLIVTNLGNPSLVYYGNDISSGDFNNQESTNTPPVFDSVNNIENVFLPAGAGTNFSVTVFGNRVNVNAVTAQTNNFTGAYAPNVVQDYALVISSGNGQVTNAMMVTTNVIPFASSSPTGDQLITFISPTNSGSLLNQYVGASSPLLGTNSFLVPDTVAVNGEANEQITIGETNQWHFYVVTNPVSGASDVTNAAFITFTPPTLSIPREGVFADDEADATQPEADIDLYVSTNSALINLNPTVISNCVVGANGGTASLSRGGTEFVVYTNSAPGEVYYVGVKSETQEASEYSFLPVFSATPFSQMTNGNEYITGYPIPAVIPGGNPAVPGYTDVVALATFPIEIRNAVVSDSFYTEDFGDLVGAVNLNDSSVILNNHDSENVPGTYSFIYDDSGSGDIPGSQFSDGPGSLTSLIGQQGDGPWILHEADNVEGFSNVVENFSVEIQPHQDLNSGITVSLPPHSWFYDYIDVPPGATNLTVDATNLTIPPGTPPVELFVKYEELPTLTNFDGMATLTNGNPPGASITNPPPYPFANGRYFIGVYNPSSTTQTSVFITATVGLATASQVVYTSSGTNAPILDDAVTTNSIFVTQDKIISSVDVALRVDHPRVSDLVFHLISPDGTRVLLVENRGGTSTNGMGVTLTASNTVAQTQTSSGDGSASTNIIVTGQTNGTLTVNYDFFSLPDEMLVLDPSGNTNFDSGEVSGSGVFNIPYTSSPLTIIMNPNNNGGSGDLWDYSVDVAGAQYEYLVLTEDTNKTMTPIKFAPTPFTNFSSFPAANTNGVQILTGPINSSVNGHNYYLLQTNNWTGSETWAEKLGGHLATIRNATENSWVVDTFSNIGGNRDFWIGLYDPTHDTNGLPHASNFVWVDGEPVTYTNWRPGGDPNDGAGGPHEYWTFIYGVGPGYPTGTWDDFTNVVFDTGVNNISGVAEISPTPGDLYYQPEQPLSAVAGENAQGQWTLEIQDDRAGAGLTNSLVSWQLRFNFTTAAANSGTLTNGVPQTNNAPANSMAYYLITVPTNADFATNFLFMTNGPLSLWFNQTTPPTGTNSGDYLLFSASTTNSSVLTTNSTSPPFFVPGGSYYLGVQNTNGFAVNYGIQVNFLLSIPPTPPVLQSIGAQTNNELSTLTVTNTATDTNAGVTLSYNVTMSINTGAMITNGWPTNYATTNPTPVISTNGIITWTPSESQGPGVYIITTVVTDNNVPPLSDTNSFTVTVNEVNTPPFFTNTPPNQTINPLTTLTVTNAAVDTDSPPNTLSYMLLNPPVEMTINTNGIITWTPTVNQGGTTNLITTIVTDNNPYAINSQHLSATNSFTVFVNLSVQSVTNSFSGGFGPITTDGTNIYVVSTSAGAATNYILAIPLPSGGSAIAVYPNVDPGGTILGLAVHNTNLFWIDPIGSSGGSTAIFQGDTNGDLPNEFDPTSPVPINFGGDITSDGTQLFATDNSRGSVFKLGFDFSNFTRIGTNRYPSTMQRSITLTALNGFVYTADFSNRVVSVSTNGGVWTTNYVGAPLIHPSGIAASGDALFITDPSATNTIWLLPISGGTPGSLISGPPFRVLNRITYWNHSLFVTDNDTNGVNGIIYEIFLPNPTPSVGSVSVATNGVTLDWSAPIYDQFNVQWTTNLVSPWNTFQNLLISTNGAFTFTDTNAPLSTKFYRLVELP